MPSNVATIHIGSISVLAHAARVGGRAPSILNTQPWQWRIRDDVLQLRADRGRRVPVIDPDGRLLTVSCGAALHHARVALAAGGYGVAITRRPDLGDPSLMATLRLTGRHSITDHDVELIQAVRRRRTERRPFPATRPVGDPIVAQLAAVARAEGAWLHRVRPVQRPFLELAARVAHATQTEDERYLAELHRWTRRRGPTGDGVPAETIVAPVPRPVSVRDFSPGAGAGLHPGPGDDRNAEYLIVATDADGPDDWLAAGEACSALWLTATSRGLAGSPMSDLVEVPWARAVVASLLPTPGHPQLVMRVGFDLQPSRPPASPRRPANEPSEEGTPLR